MSFVTPESLQRQYSKDRRTIMYNRPLDTVTVKRTTSQIPMPITHVLLVVPLWENGYNDTPWVSLVNAAAVGPNARNWAHCKNPLFIAKDGKVHLSQCGQGETIFCAPPKLNTVFRTGDDAQMVVSLEYIESILSSY